MSTAPQPLADRVALVTGGGTGIGLAISRRLAAGGASVAVHQRTESKAQAAAAALRAEGGSAEPVVADLRTLDGCRATVDACVRALGRIDILVNNAAVTGPAALTPILELDDERLEEMAEHIGAAQGPIVSLLGGIHGDEEEGVLAVQRVAALLDAAPPVRGAVRTVAVAHPAADAANRRTSPLDGRKLARCFPGDAAGTASERLADALTERVIRGTSPASPWSER